MTDQAIAVVRIAHYFIPLVPNETLRIRTCTPSTVPTGRTIGNRKGPMQQLWATEVRMKAYPWLHTGKPPLSDRLFTED